ncbi:MAG: glycosyltransferase family 4 protein [Clostridia bacterium]|nr:glycosyltransferase family 4 protein [Clostridia bacterium]
MSILADNLIYKNKNIEIISFLDRNDTYELKNDIKLTVLKCKSKNKVFQKLERILKLRKEINKNKEEITIISFEYFVNMQTILANMFLKNKLIVSERNDPARTGNGKITRKLRNLLYRFADYLVCQTPGAKDYFPKKIQNKTVVIPNPIMPDLPNRFEGTRKKEIVTFCRIEKQKNLTMLVDAFKLLNEKYPEYKLVIYGDGSERESLKKYIKEIGMEQQIELNDFIQNIHSKITDSAMFVSSSDYEGISNSMLEAMGIGLPTVCTDCPCGGAKMMIENDENGILVPVRDKVALYKAMKKIIENPGFAEMISNNATKIKYKLEQNKICELWMNLIKN